MALRNTRQREKKKNPGVTEQAESTPVAQDPDRDIYAYVETQRKEQARQTEQNKPEAARRFVASGANASKNFNQPWNSRNEIENNAAYQQSRARWTADNAEKAKSPLGTSIAKDRILLKQQEDVVKRYAERQEKDSALYGALEKKYGITTDENGNYQFPDSKTYARFLIDTKNSRDENKALSDKFDSLAVQRNENSNRISRSYEEYRKNVNENTDAITRLSGMPTDDLIRGFDYYSGRYKDRMTDENAENYGTAAYLVTNRLQQEATGSSDFAEKSKANVTDDLAHGIYFSGTIKDSIFALVNYEDIMSHLDDRSKSNFLNRLEESSSLNDIGLDFSRVSQMDSGQKAVYNYYYNSGQKDKAEAYVRSIMSYLSNKSVNEQVEDLNEKSAAGRVASSFVYGFENALHFVENWFTDEGYAPDRRQAQAISMGNAGGLERILRGSAQSIGAMLPSIAASALTGGVAGGLGASANLAQSLGAGAGALSTLGTVGGDSRVQAKQMGFSDEEANLYGVAVGSLESATQYMIGGISRLSGASSLSSRLSSALSERIESTVGRFVMRYGSSVASEVLEENIQNYLEPLAATVIAGVPYDAPGWEEFVDTTLSTVLTTLVMEAPNARSIMSNVKWEKTLMEQSRVLIESGNENLQTLGESIRERMDAGDEITPQQFLQEFFDAGSKIDVEESVAEQVQPVENQTEQESEQRNDRETDAATEQTEENQRSEESTEENVQPEEGITIYREPETSLDSRDKLAESNRPEPIDRLRDRQESEKRRSEFVYNTLKNSPVFGGVFNDVYDQMVAENEEATVYDVIHELDSMFEANQRVNADPMGEAAYLLGKNDEWTSVDIDTAMGLIASHQLDGNVEMAQELAAKLREKATSAGQKVQAFAKWTRTVSGTIQDTIANLNDGTVSRERLNEITRLLLDVGRAVDENSGAQNGNNSGGENGNNGNGENSGSENGNNDGGGNDGQRRPSYLVDQIERLAQFRGTTTYISDELSATARRFLLEQDDDYLQSVLMAQIRAVGEEQTTTRTAAEIMETQLVLNQLSSLVTTMRNLGANFVFDVVDSVSTNAATVFDRLMGTRTGRRTVGADRSWFSADKRHGAIEGFTRAYVESFLDVNPENAESRYGTTTNRLYKMSGNIVERFMSRWEKYLNYALQATDELSKGGIEAEYRRATNDFVARGQLSPEDQDAFATRLAEERTFQQDSALARFAQNFKAFLNTAGISQKSVFITNPENDRQMRIDLDASGDVLDRAASYLDMTPAQLQQAIANRTVDTRFGLGNFFLNYPKIPSNLAVTAFNYSPFGFIKGLFDTINVMRYGRGASAESQRNAAMLAGRGVNGTGMTIAFSMLAKAGVLLVAGLGDDEDRKRNSAMGVQGISGIQLNFSALSRLMNGGKGDLRDGDTLMSADFLEPVTFLMTLGAMYAEVDSSIDEEADQMDRLARYLGASASAMSTAVIETPAMEAFSQLYDSATEDNGKGILQSVGDSVLNTLSSGVVPAPVRQIAKATDPYYREQYSSDSALKQTWDKFRNNIPGLRETLPIKTDSYGDDKTYEDSAALRAFNALVNPGEIRTYKQSDIEAEIERVYQETGESAYSDTKVPTSFTYRNERGDKVEVTLTAQDKIKYREERGRLYKEMVGEIIKSDVYRALEPEEQYAMLKEAYDLSTEEAKRKIDSGYKTTDKILKLHGNGIGFNTIYTVKLAKKELDTMVDNGDVTKQEAAENLKTFVDGLGLPRLQRELLLDAYKSWTMTPVGTDKYDDIVNAGFDGQYATEITNAIRELRPAEGATSVLAWQKWESICQTAKYEDQAEIIPMFMTDSQKNKFEQALATGIAPREYVDIYKARYTYGDANGTWKKAELRSYLKEQGYSASQISVLMDIFT